MRWLWTLVRAQIRLGPFPIQVGPKMPLAHYSRRNFRYAAPGAMNGDGGF